jgi:hypothetical protein
MTTSVEEALQAHFGAAAGANPFGFVAIVVAVLLLAFRPARLQVSGALIVLAGSASWIFELHRFSIL